MRINLKDIRILLTSKHKIDRSSFNYIIKRQNFLIINFNKAKNKTVN